MCCNSHELFCTHLFRVHRMHGSHNEYTFCKRSRFVEHRRLYLRKFFKIIYAFAENALTGGSANAGKETQWHGNYKCARARHHQEEERTVNPRMEVTILNRKTRHKLRYDWRQHRKQ